MAATVVMQGSVKDFNCIQDIDDHFTSLIHFVAESSIPISSRQYHRPSVTSNCQRKKSCSKIAETMTQQCALIQYKWTQAKARRVLKEARLLERANPFHPCSEDRWHNAHRPKRCCKWASKLLDRSLEHFCCPIFHTGLNINNAQCRLSYNLPYLRREMDSDIPGDYRPISLTSCICKLMEEMVNFRLIWILEKGKVLTPYQYGFR